jgi:predicted nucleic acid-binding protein
VIRASFDSNILIYAEGTDDMDKRRSAIDLVARLGPENVVVSMQSAGETLRWMLRKGKVARGEAVLRLGWWLRNCAALPVSVAAFNQALSLVENHALQIWDAVILACSAEARAAILFSEDMQHGFTWSGVTIVNPFILTPETLDSLIPPRTFH